MMDCSEKTLFPPIEFVMSCMPPRPQLLALVFCTLLVSANASAQIIVQPASVELEGNFAQTQLIVTASSDIEDQRADLTSVSKFESLDPLIASVDETGRILAKGDGSTVIRVTANAVTKEIPVKVHGVVDSPSVKFNRDIMPILSKSGCNMGACHATQYGQGGFKLSVFGFEPAKDREAIIRDRHQRRTNFVEPADSLFLLKPTMQVPHGGGKRLSKNSVDHAILVAWLANGAPKPDSKTPTVTALEVFPKQRVGQSGFKQQLRVVATYSDDKTRDVTAWAKYDSMDEGMLDVSPSGLVSTQAAGQSSIMIRFEGQAEISMFVVPFAKNIPLSGWKNNNFVDEHAAKKFKELGIEPSPLCDDPTFIRRAFLDATGSIPTVAQTRAFIDSKEPNKRQRLVDELLGLTGDPNRDIHNDNYAAYWTLKWSDLIRNSSSGRAEQAMWSMHNWLKESFRVNKPFDKVVSELVTAKGSVYMNGPANYFRIFRNSTELTEATAQLFLGVRLECAKCHHHPFEKYSQADYYGFAAFFARVGTKRSEEFGLFGGETVVIVKTSGEVSHPKTGKRLEPTPLEGEPTNHDLDRRIALAEWLVNPANDYFAKNMVNRYVGYLLGRGLVEPIDDLRSTNPPTNPALMAALAKHFVDHKFDTKQLIRVIMTSRLYQLDSQPSKSNFKDHRFYSHYLVKRLAAEPLLDAIDQATESQTKFAKLPPGTRAIELPDAEYPNYFLNTFAKPRRASVCECERSPDENLVQALHTLNGDTLTTKLSDKNGRIARLIKEKKSHLEKVQELYLAALCRLPTEAEIKLAKEIVDGAANAQEGYEDLLWGLMNSKYFLFIH
jgi:hypothetical protein